MKIRTKAGEELDLTEVRFALEHDGWTKMLAILDALQAVLNVREVERIAVDNEWDKGFEQGFDNALKIVRQAAGVIEEHQG